MKLPLAALVVCLLATGAAADKKPSPAEASAKAWLASMTSKDGVAAVTKDKPLAFWSDTPVSSCGTGKAMTADDAKKVKKCLQDQVKAIGVEGSPAPAKLADVIKGFDKKQHAAMKAAAKDTTLVAFDYAGDGQTLKITLAVAADQSIKALWVAAEAAE
jgi:hypothetical protein